MATRNGYNTIKWLEKRGWKVIPPVKDKKGEIACGDPQVRDPETDKETNIYEAAKIQKIRTGEYPDFLSQKGSLNG